MPTDNRNHIAVAFSGSGVNARRMRVRDLIDLLTDLERALLLTASDGKARRTEPEFHLSLYQIDDREDSAVWHFVLEDNILGAARRISEAIDSRRGALLPQPATASIREFHKRLAKRQWSASLTNNTFTSYIQPATPVFSDPEITGGTTVLAKIISVGGRKPKAKLDVRGKLLTADVPNKEIAKQLAGLLYRTTTLDGTARWYVSSHAMSRFRIEKVGDFDDSSVASAAFQNLRDMGSQEWDNVDPDEYVRKLRDEADE